MAPLYIAIELQGAVLLAIVSGTFALSQAVHLFRKICDTATKHDVNKVTADSLVVDGTLSTIDSYHLGVCNGGTRHSTANEREVCVCR